MKITREEMLNKIIMKAELNGFFAWEWYCKTVGEVPDHVYKALIRYNTYPTLLFDHEFAKAFFGKTVVCANCGAIWSIPSHCCWNMESEMNSLKAWEFALRQAVTAKDRLLYYYQHI